MLLAPKKQKFRKAHKGRIGLKSKAGLYLAYGSFGLKALGSIRVTDRQIESARKAAVHHMRREGRLFIRIFPNLPVSKKPNEVRMGRGKGIHDHFAFRVAPGRIMFELDGVTPKIARSALRSASMKLPVKTKIVERHD